MTHQTAVTARPGDGYHPIRAQIDQAAGRAAKDRNSRLSRFVEWQFDEALPWYAPDLAAWRDELLALGLAPASVRAYLSTVRGAYERVLRDNSVREHLYRMAPADASPERKKAYVDELLTRLQNAVHPSTAPVEVTVKQDVADSEQLRLTRVQAQRLLDEPDVSTLPGKRDAAVIALLLCTGIREQELCALDVSDLRQSLGGELALRIRRGKGAKQRLVPYGELDWSLVLVEAWLEAAGITRGAVFRGFYRGYTAVRGTRLTPRSVQRILDEYPVVVDGARRIVRPHDCRRTYARLMYEAGVELVALQQNLGHAKIETTLGYIGTLDAQKRRAKAVIGYDLTRLHRD